ncbi:MAG: hypothetical protein C4555_07945 [Dehalococcoidia bacterium]|jgi:dnd system-associated protein 4|nr:MAG: hypothetical protein C4555_07945 [Dehalococcoidia bacterium]
MATRNRIYIDKKLVPLADRLVFRNIPGSESEQGVFRDTRELIAFAATIGYKFSHKRTVHVNGREIKLSAVERIQLGGIELVEALAVAETGDIEILSKENEVRRAEILEKYANGGLERIEAISGDRTALEEIVNIIKAEYAIDDKQLEVVDLLSERL